MNNDASYIPKCIDTNCIRVHLTNAKKINNKEIIKKKKFVSPLICPLLTFVRLFNILFVTEVNYTINILLIEIKGKY